MFIIDFDDTLFDTFEWKKTRYAPLQSLGISQELAQQTYREVRALPNGVYSNDAHAVCLARYGFPREEVKTILEQTVGEAMKTFLFPDTIYFLEEIKKMNQTMMLLTKGDAIFQREKVNATGIGKYFDDMRICDIHKEPVVHAVVEVCHQSGVVWFVNNNIEETQRVKNACPLIRPVMKVSPPHEKKEYEPCGFPSFKTLTEIAQYVTGESP